jgi:hypothetical protein
MLWALVVAAPGPNPVAESAVRLRSAAAAAATSTARDACLEAWAAAWRGPPPPDASPSERRALEARGALRLYANAEGEKLHLGWVDPDGVIGRVEAALLRPEGDRRPLPVVGPKTRRLPAAARGQVEVVARARDCLPGAALAILRLPIDAQIPVPTAPVAPSRTPRVSPEPAPGARAPPFAWWWYAALGVVAAGVGLAALEEAR